MLRQASITAPTPQTTTRGVQPSPEFGIDYLSGRCDYSVEAYQALKTLVGGSHLEWAEYYGNNVPEFQGLSTVYVSGSCFLAIDRDRTRIGFLARGNGCAAIRAHHNAIDEAALQELVGRFVDIITIKRIDFSFDDLNSLLPVPLLRQMAEAHQYRGVLIRVRPKLEINHANGTIIEREGVVLTNGSRNRTLSIYTKEYDDRSKLEGCRVEMRYRKERAHETAKEFQRVGIKAVTADILHSVRFGQKLKVGDSDSFTPLPAWEEFFSFVQPCKIVVHRKAEPTFDQAMAWLNRCAYNSFKRVVDGKGGGLDVAIRAISRGEYGNNAYGPNSSFRTRSGRPPMPGGIFPEQSATEDLDEAA